MGYYFYPYFSYILYMLPAIIITVFAQIKVKSNFAKYSKVYNRRGYTGAMIARMILDQNGLNHVAIEMVSGQLTDHYDPRTNVVRLSSSVYNSTSVAALGVAAHEVGHAIQHSQGYVPMKFRGAIIPITQIGSQLSWPLFFIGLIFQMDILLTIGIVLFAAVVLFQLVTLPVEFNASSRALRTLESNYYLEPDEMVGAKKMLSAAAMTYVASLITAILQLFRLLAIAGNRRDD